MSHGLAPGDFLMRHLVRILVLICFCLSLFGGGPVGALQSRSSSKIPAAPEDGGPRAWEVTGISSTLNMRQEPSTSATVIESLRAGAILQNKGGCLQAEGRVWCDVQRLPGGLLGYVAAEYLRPAKGPDGAVPRGPDNSARRASQGDFDASGQLPCAQDAGQPMAMCDYSVARAGGGYATVVVSKPDGGKRALHFSLGIPIGADTSQADGFGKFKAEREGNLHIIRVGDERYQVSEAIVVGG